jgi:hypothetical protein
MPRPKESPRIILTARVLPEVDKAIRSKVERGNRKKNTIGKILDKKFQP